MTPEALEQFFLWCTIVNTVIYLFTVFAVLLLKSFVLKIHQLLFQMDEAATLQSIQHYLGNFKLFITVFNFTPWLVLVMMG
ncbi:MAG TPA: hypothetical protein ENK72_02580 [Epsilonproteobacteria bacterium]|nr:hypothetical protein [Campylobacterota bacterium]